MGLLDFFFEGGNERVEQARRVEAKAQKTVIAANARAAQDRARAKQEKAQRDARAKADKAYAKELAETRRQIKEANKHNEAAARKAGHTYMDKKPQPKSGWWD